MKRRRPAGKPAGLLFFRLLAGEATCCGEPILELGVGLRDGKLWKFLREVLRRSKEKARIGFAQRDEMIATEPDTYYLKDHYVNYPVVLVRLSRVHADALRDLLLMAWRFTSATNKRQAVRQSAVPTSARKRLTKRS